MKEFDERDNDSHWFYKKPTKKQLEFIEAIEKELDVKYHRKSQCRGSAADFISTYRNEYDKSVNQKE